MTNDLIERLEKTAKTMNGGGSVGASDGMGTTLVGYYDTSCAKLDLEAATTLRSKDAEIAKLWEALERVELVCLSEDEDEPVEHVHEIVCTVLGVGDE